MLYIFTFQTLPLISARLGNCAADSLFTSLQLATGRVGQTAARPCNENTHIASPGAAAPLLRGRSFHLRCGAESGRVYRHGQFCLIYERDDTT